MDNYGDVDEKYNYKFPDEQKKPQDIEIEIEGETEIEVVDDTPEQDRGREPMKEPPAEVTDDELAQYSEGVKKRIKHFSKGYHDERRAKEAAQREKDEALRLAQSLIEENKKLQGSLGQGQQALLEQAKKVVATEVEDAKRRLKEAHESGDTEAFIAAQEELTTAKIRAERVNNFKPAVAKAPEPVVQPASQPPEPAPQVDSKARAWQDANPWFGKNREMTATALAIHQDLVENGVDPTSDQYYESINARVRKRFPEAFPSARKPTNVVAPATRSTAPKKIVLTQSQVSIAKRLGVPLEAYARSVAEQMRKENG
jgi:hypothetical protein